VSEPKRIQRPDSIYSKFHADNWTDYDFAKHTDATRKTLAWLLELEAHADAMVKALQFYANPIRYEGANQRNDINDPYSDSAPYIRDASRDGGEIARAALRTAAQGRKGDGDGDAA